MMVKVEHHFKVPKDPFEEMLEQTWTCPTCGDVNLRAIMVCPICRTVVPKDAVPRSFEEILDDGSSLILEQLLEEERKEQEATMQEVREAVGQETTVGEAAEVVEVAEVEELFKKVEDFFREHFYFGEEDWPYRICTLWVLQTAVAKSLPVWFYLWAGGPYGSGKTELLHLLSLVSGGLVLGNVSIAALARLSAAKATVLLDEYDSTRGKEIDAMKDEMWRSGYREGAFYTRAVGAGAEVVKFPIDGPKAATFRGEVDVATMSRGFVLPTVKYSGPKGIDYVHKTMFAEAGTLPQELRQWGQKTMKMKKWSRAQCKEMVQETSFREKLRHAVPPNMLGATRETQLGTIALIVCEMIDVNIIADIHRAFELSSMVTGLSSVEDLEEFYEIFLAESAKQIAEGDEREKFVKIENAKLKRRLNKYREVLGKFRLSQKKFSVLRRDAGIGDQYLHKKDGRVVFWVPHSVIADMKLTGTW